MHTGFFLKIGAVMGMAVMLSSAAFAQTLPPGCDARVMDHMNAKAELNKAIDRATAEVYITQPHSVLFTTCFAAQAKQSAEVGGAIFSGDYSAELAPVVNAVLEQHAKNFEHVPEVEDNSMRKYYELYDIEAADVPGYVADCPALSELWDKIANEPLNTGVPHMTIEQIVNDVPAGRFPPGTNQRFIDSMTSPSTLQLIENYKRTLAGLPSAAATPDCRAAKTTCEFYTCVNGGVKPEGC